MKVQKGRTYVACNGEKFGPMEVWEGFTEDATGGLLFHIGDDKYWCSDGTYSEPHTEPNPDLDLIAEWTDGPVRTVTRREVVEGVYAHVAVCPHEPGTVLVGFAHPHDQHFRAMTSDELKAAAAVLLELAGALSDGE